MTKIKRWALWSRDFQSFYKPRPHQTEVLFDSRRSAEAVRLSMSAYGYRPVKVELHYSSDSSKGGK
jgi:hypothetical protein